MPFFPFVIYWNKLLKQNYRVMHYLVNNFVLLQKLGMEVSWAVIRSLRIRLGTTYLVEIEKFLLKIL